MQKFDFPRLMSEVRPTFVPYKQFKVRTRLSPEQCRERLMSATQPQKMPALFSAPTSSDAHIVFKGQVAKTGFIVVPVDHNGSQRYRGPQPFWLLGRFKPSFGGTDVVVQVFPNLMGFFVACSLFGAVIAEAIVAWQSSMLEKLTFGPVILAELLFTYAVLAFPVSFRAYQSKKTLERLFQ